ncbi:MAG: WG repeat-containing protein [Rikenellaceae bacterium]
MNISLKELTHLFAQPQNYAIEFEGGILPLYGDGVKMSRSNDNVEFLVERAQDRYLITIAMTTGYLDRCNLLESAIAKMGTTLFTPYKVERRRISSHSSPIANIRGKMVIQTIPQGWLLSDHLKESTEEEIQNIFGTLRYLEEQLRNMQASFSTLCPEDIIVGDDGLLYPFRYQKLRFNQTDGRGCDKLRAWIEESSGVKELPNAQPSAQPSARYLPQELFEGHLYTSTPHEDRVVVEDPTGFGYVDSSNRSVIPSVYLWADDFREGRAEVQTADGFGLIDTDGGVVIPAIYDSLGYNDESGITAVRKGDRWAYFSYCGERLTPFVDEYPNEDIRLDEIVKGSAVLADELYQPL